MIYRECQGKLYYLRYMVEDSGDYVVVATTRPETILGDTALCVNPNDPRYTSLKGKNVIVPLVGRSIPVIYDDYVDMEFGTGALKVTPAHDVNDYMLGEKYGLEAIDIFNDNGTINGKVGLYAGMDRFDVREQIEKDLNSAGLMEKVEDYTNKVGFSERTHVAIEPKLSMQWFLRMEDIAKPALEAVMEDIVKFVPPKFKNTYRHWMENIKDWCISRQLWWGHRIPAWFLPQGGFVVAETEEQALLLARERTGDDSLALADLRHDDDVLDTWFSSWLWPISVFNGIMEPDNADINYYYPTSDLVTAPDIIFFWVARMIMSGYEYRDEKPFGAVYFTGVVRDLQGRKMSKSLGNSPDPLDLITKYGADGVRVGMMLCTSAGNDLMFDESLVEQGRNFGNKVWNAFRLVGGWKVDTEARQADSSRLAVEWFEGLMARTLGEIDADFAAYRISEAMMRVYKLFWDDFSGWYLEMVKPAYGEPIDRETMDATRSIFDRLLRMLHPFMPFVTEELWQALEERAEGESIMVSEMPKAVLYDGNMLARFELVKEAVTNIRSIRQAKNIPNKETLALKVMADGNYHAEYDPVLIKMANLSGIESVAEKDPGALSFIVKTTQYFVPMDGMLDVEEELKKLKDELAYQQGFLASVMKKLGNERFVQSAPAKVVETEQAKKSDAEAKISAIEERIKALS